MWNWYNIFNLTDWLATELVSRTLTLDIVGIGETEFLITQGNETGITVGDAFLPLNFEGSNPFVSGSKGVYVDANNDVWYGVST